MCVFVMSRPSTEGASVCALKPTGCASNYPIHIACMYNLRGCASTRRIAYTRLPSVCLSVSLSLSLTHSHSHRHTHPDTMQTAYSKNTTGHERADLAHYLLGNYFQYELFFSRSGSEFNLPPRSVTTRQR